MSLLCIYLKDTLLWYTLLAFISSKKRKSPSPGPNMAAYWELSTWRILTREWWQTISNTLAGYGWTLRGRSKKVSLGLETHPCSPASGKWQRFFLLYAAVLWQSHYSTFWTLLKQNSCTWICVGVCIFFYTCTFKYVSIYYCKTKRGDRQWHQWCTMH